MDRADVAVSGALALGSFEKTEVELFRQILKESMNVVDIGAHIGYYTLIAGRRVGPSGKVFSYEPEKLNFSFLKRNIDLNKLNNVQIHNHGIADISDKRTLYLDNHNRGHNSLANDKKKRSTVEISLETLDNALDKYGSPKIDIIKMDIEGAEVLALAGMKKTIARNPKIIIFTEFYPKAIERLGHSPMAFLKELITLGFSLSVINEDKSSLTNIENLEKFVSDFPGGEAFRNILATRKK